MAEESKTNKAETEIEKIMREVKETERKADLDLQERKSRMKTKMGKETRRTISVRWNPKAEHYTEYLLDQVCGEYGVIE